MEKLELKQEELIFNNVKYIIEINDEFGNEIVKLRNTETGKYEERCLRDHTEVRIKSRENRNISKKFVNILMKSRIITVKE